MYIYLYVDECPLLTSPEYGSIVSVTGNTINDTAVIKCFENFVLMGSAIRQCQPNGYWSGNDTTCVGKLTITVGIKKERNVSTKNYSTSNLNTVYYTHTTQKLNATTDCITQNYAKLQTKLCAHITHIN